MNEHASDRGSASFLTMVVFLIVLPFFLAFAMVGTLVRSGGGFSVGGYGTYAVYEHGWPFPFGERLESRDSNRFTVWSGDRTYSWNLILTDGVIAAGIAALVAMLVRMCAVRKWWTITLGILLFGTLVAWMSTQIYSALERSEVELAAGTRLDDLGCYVDWKYSGPLWLIRLTGGRDKWSEQMSGVPYIRIEDEVLVGNPEKISYFCQETHNFHFLEKVDLWGEMTISYGPDFEAQLREIMSAIEETGELDSSLPQPEDSWIPAR